MKIFKVYKILISRLIVLETLRKKLKSFLLRKSPALKKNKIFRVSLNYCILLFIIYFSFYMLLAGNADKLIKSLDLLFTINKVKNYSLCIKRDNSLDPN